VEYLFIKLAVVVVVAVVVAVVDAVVGVRLFSKPSYKTSKPNLNQ